MQATADQTLTAGTAADLAARINIENPGRIADIGCGPGNSTRVLAQRFPDATIVGADKSAHMVEKAREENPDLDFIVCDAASELNQLGGGFDVVFSNACIQWIPDHRSLLTEMIGLLKPGGILAVQVPLQMRQPIYKIILEAARNGKWKNEFPGDRIFHNFESEAYFDLLCEIAADFNLWETVYYHRLKSPVEIMEWYRGTGLRPYLAALPEGKQKEFERDVFERVKEAYPERLGGVIFRFPRLFFTAVR